MLTFPRRVKEIGVCCQWRMATPEIDALGGEDVMAGSNIPSTQNLFIFGPSVRRHCPLLGLLQSVNLLQTGSEVCVLGKSQFYQVDHED